MNLHNFYERNKRKLAACRWGGDYIMLSLCFALGAIKRKGIPLCSIPRFEVTLAPLNHMMREGLNFYLACVASIAPNEKREKDEAETNIA